ncbi:NADP-dependent oxidoreductase domain-containing protein [Dimargaris cristalligena]|uniref:NADP-dependent oxidoreductase domain-containing protein n=1 Tax=Dimargaris cristalligena TaxID=215637 RepID=A0A4P9ZM79_9FUNG|nr:NADP-dependent oxidoreductase domain-containing protein [Dimargaris cristalligena]|eukprot:RKP34283.1 NADP-dependent oxidoreductase domain-containing protein [Dimargaris cristalligena]
MASGRTFKLNSGSEIPALGLGTARAKENAVREAVEVAYRAGYRHFDCAALYANQDEVGEAFRNLSIDRPNTWVTSKLWNTEHRPEDVGPACDATLRQLGLDYLDLYLIHWPVAFRRDGTKFCTSLKDSEGTPIRDETVSMVDTWKAMEKLVQAGKVRHIGVSNFNIPQLEYLQSIASIPPAVNQVEIHPYCQNRKLLEYCRANGIHLTAYCPLGSIGKPSVLDDPAIQAVAQETNRSPAEVCLAWGIQRGYSVIPKSVTPMRIRDNFQDDLRLTDSQMKRISDIDHTVRACDGRICYVQEVPDH